MNSLAINKKTLSVLGVIVLLLLAITPSIYFYNQYQQVKKNSPEIAEKDLQTIKAKVAKHIQLPSNEEPVLATVSDTNKLQGQSFFSSSQNGDKVLIFTEARKAYLYRPSADKLIEVATININTNDSGQPAVSQDIKSESIRIVLRNGTSVVGLTNKLEPEINKTVPNATITKKENAAKNDYQTTMIVALNEKGQQSAQILAQYFKTSPGTLPAGENNPTEADVLVILGSDTAPAVTPSSTPTNSL
jgi:hypothetical protein